MKNNENKKFKIAKITPGNDFITWNGFDGDMEKVYYVLFLDVENPCNHIERKIWDRHFSEEEFYIGREFNYEDIKVRRKKILGLF